MSSLSHGTSPNGDGAELEADKASGLSIQKNMMKDRDLQGVDSCMLAVSNPRKSILRSGYMLEIGITVASVARIPGKVIPPLGMLPERSELWTPCDMEM
jgi:hypothetical protein